MDKLDNLPQKVKQLVDSSNSYFVLDDIIECITSDNVDIVKAFFIKSITVPEKDVLYNPSIWFNYFKQLLDIAVEYKYCKIFEFLLKFRIVINPMTHDEIISTSSINCFLINDQFKLKLNIHDIQKLKSTYDHLLSQAIKDNDFKVIQILLKSRVNSPTVLETTIKSVMKDCSISGDLKMFKQLINSYFSTVLDMNKLCTDLFEISVKCDYMNIIEYFLSSKLNNLQLGNNESYSIRHAVINGNVKLVKTLCELPSEMGLDLTVRNNMIIRVAFQYEMYRIIHYLLSLPKNRGIDIHDNDNFIVNYALEGKNKDLLDILCYKCYCIELLPYFAGKGYLKEMKHLCHVKNNYYTDDQFVKYKNEAFVQSVKGKQMEVMKYLMTLPDIDPCYNDNQPIKSLQINKLDYKTQNILEYLIRDCRIFENNRYKDKLLKNIKKKDVNYFLSIEILIESTQNWRMVKAARY